MIEMRKIFLYGALIVIAFMLWTQWQRDYPPSSAVSQTATVENKKENQATGYIPQVNNQNAEQAATQSQTVAALPTEEKVPADRLVTIRTDVLDITIDTLGGNIIGTKLLKYPHDINDKNKPMSLLNNDPQSRYVAQSGISYVNANSNQAMLFTTTQKNYVLNENQNEIQVKLTHRTKDGISIDKVYHFKRDNYLINLDYQITNQTKQEWSGSIYAQLMRIPPHQEQSAWFPVSSYTGAAVSDPQHKLYEKVTFKDMDKASLNRTVKGGWIAMQQHYFLSAWIPEPTQLNNYYSNVNKQGEYTIGLMSPLLKVAPGQTVTKEAKLYVGPELPNVLKQIAPGLDLTIDYGWLWFISGFLFLIMSYIYRWVGNWGLSIVIVTVLIKLAFYHLSATSYRSMANMRKLQPRMQALREQYANDKAKLSQSMMELYKNEKVNPLGGCLPIIVQIPVFIALYWVLLESVELRHAPFFGWIKDLSAADPYYVLPILMGLTMIIQQKLSPAPPDPTQAKVMMILPVVFTFLFLSFPAGLVLYWVVNNTLSILQQWYITQKYETKSNGKSVKVVA